METILSSLKKAVAIFKDSIREARDIKILYVTVILAILFTLFVLSLNFRPLPANEVLDANYALLNWALSTNPQTGKTTMGTSDFQRLDGGTEPWTGDYRFVFSVTFEGPVPEQYKKDFSGQKLQQLIPALCEWAERVEVVPLSPAANQLGAVAGNPVAGAASSEINCTRFLVTTKGSKYRTRQEWYHQPGLIFGLVELPLKTYRLNQIVNFIAGFLLGTFGSGFMMLLSAIVTAFFIPNMMSRGTIDLLVTKPIHRMSLFIYKFLGGLTFMFVNAFVIMTGIWLALGLQAGVWCHTLLLCILIYTFEFAIFYAVSALVGVLTRTPILSILAVVFFWGLVTGVGWAHWHMIEKPRARVGVEAAMLVGKQEKAFDVLDFIVEVLHAVLPR
jgi:hypothetical protein